MRALRRFFSRLASWATTRRDEQRLRAEIEEHLALQTADNVRAGLSAADARRQAILKFGPVEAMSILRGGDSMALLLSRADQGAGGSSVCISDKRCGYPRTAISAIESRARVSSTGDATRRSARRSTRSCGRPKSSRERTFQQGAWEEMLVEGKSMVIVLP
jgi:hypothetical protein